MGSFQIAANIPDRQVLLTCTPTWLDPSKLDGARSSVHRKRGHHYSFRPRLDMFNKTSEALAYQGRGTPQHGTRYRK